VKVKNTGKRASDEVVQLYVRHAQPKLRQAVKSLRGFERVRLAAGEERTVTFRLSPAKDFAHYDAAARRYAVEPGPYEVQVGGSSKDIRLTGALRVD
jgi:beta-glucosidase